MADGDPSLQDAAAGATKGASSKVREQVQQATGQALGRARAEVDQRSDLYGEQVVTFAQEVRLVGAELRKQGKDTPAKVIDQVADRTGQLGQQLKQVDADTLTDYAKRIEPAKLVRSAEDLGRRRPLLFLAGGLALGFLPSRLLKAASARRAPAATSPLSPVGGDVPPLGGVPPAGNGTAGGGPIEIEPVDVDRRTAESVASDLGVPPPPTPPVRRGDGRTGRPGSSSASGPGSDLPSTTL